MDIYEQNAAYEECLRQDMEREFQEQLKKIEELTKKEEREKENELEKNDLKKNDLKKNELENELEKPTKEQLRNLRMKFYIGNNNDKNTK